MDPAGSEGFTKTVTTSVRGRGERSIRLEQNGKRRRRRATHKLKDASEGNKRVSQSSLSVEADNGLTSSDISSSLGDGPSYGNDDGDLS